MRFLSTRQDVQIRTWSRISKTTAIGPFVKLRVDLRPGNAQKFSSIICICFEYLEHKSQSLRTSYRQEKPIFIIRHRGQLQCPIQQQQCACYDTESMLSVVSGQNRQKRALIYGLTLYQDAFLYLET